MYQCIVFNTNRSIDNVCLLMYNTAIIVITIYVAMLLSLFHASMVDPFYRLNGKHNDVSHAGISESSSSQVYFLISRLNFIPFADDFSLCPDLIYNASIKLVWFGLIWFGCACVYVSSEHLRLRLGRFEFIKQVK